MARTGVRASGELRGRALFLSVLFLSGGAAGDPTSGGATVATSGADFVASLPMRHAPAGPRAVRVVHVHVGMRTVLTVLCVYSLSVLCVLSGAPREARLPAGAKPFIFTYSLAFNPFPAAGRMGPLRPLAMVEPSVARESVGV